MKRLILVGSPRTEGRCAALADAIFETNIEEHPEDELFLVPVSEIDVAPCIGCDGCKALSEVVIKDDSGEEVTLMEHRCVFDDDMQTIHDLLDDVDEVIVVSPVYFSGAPAPFKCVIDRLQPFFWTDARKQKKRPLILHVLGEGGDPHGFSALVSEVRSAFSVAGFALERVLDWVGKVDEEGNILEEATVRSFDGDVQVPKDITSDPSDGSTGRNRPKLDLSAKGQDPARKKGSGKNSNKGAKKGAGKPSSKKSQKKGSKRG